MQIAFTDKFQYHVTRYVSL